MAPFDHGLRMPRGLDRSQVGIAQVNEPVRRLGPPCDSLATKPAPSMATFSTLVRLSDGNPAQEPAHAQTRAHRFHKAGLPEPVPPGELQQISDPRPRSSLVYSYSVARSALLIWQRAVMFRVDAFRFRRCDLLDSLPAGCASDLPVDPRTPTAWLIRRLGGATDWAGVTPPWVPTAGRFAGAVDTASAR
jgi:hypothetical protein